ncbi:MAG: dipeptidase [Bacteroidetes bacterium]|nr:dipeptidase [Bacteroidota bacterium]
MQTIKEYIHTNQSRFLEELFGLIRIPSVSSVSEHKEDMTRAASYLANELKKAGADISAVYSTSGHPVVFGKKIIDPYKPTVLVYGHYDVMPVDPVELWNSDPFEPVIRDGKIIARGSADDKGQLFMQVKAFEYLLASDLLPCNIKFMIEGEEEMGSPALASWCQENKELLSADLILVSDTSMIGINTPSITVGLRGLAYMEIEVTGPDKDLHSGLYGGAVANPANILAKIIASLHDENNRITIPGFYDDVEILSAEERADMARAPFNIKEYQQKIKIKNSWGEAGYSVSERTSIRPTLDVNGIWGGYIGEGSKTVLPSKASAKISMRLVPNQDPDKTAELFAKHIESISPDTVSVKVIAHHGGFPYVSPVDSRAYNAASKAYETTFGKKPIPVRSGGSIPIISTFEKVLGIKSLLMGFGLDTDLAHSPNENYHLECFNKGIETIVWFYRYFAGDLSEDIK